MRPALPRSFPERSRRAFSTFLDAALEVALYSIVTYVTGLDSLSKQTRLASFRRRGRATEREQFLPECKRGVLVLEAVIVVADGHSSATVRARRTLPTLHSCIIARLSSTRTTGPHHWVSELHVVLSRFLGDLRLCTRQARGPTPNDNYFCRRIASTVGCSDRVPHQ